MTTESRRALHVRVLAPFACLFGRIDLQPWSAIEGVRFGGVLNVSLDGAKAMNPDSMNPGDHLTFSLSLPDQIVPMNVDAAIVKYSDSNLPRLSTR